MRDDACELLGACGLLPSPLGAELSPGNNCKARCEESGASVRDPIFACVANSDIFSAPSGLELVSADRRLDS